MSYLLPFPVDSIDVVVMLMMGWHYNHALMGVVLVVVLPDTGFGVAVGIVLWGLAGSFLAWLVVL